MKIFELLIANFVKYELKIIRLFENEFCSSEEKKIKIDLDQNFSSMLPSVGKIKHFSLFFFISLFRYVSLKTECFNYSLLSLLKSVNSNINFSFNILYWSLFDLFCFVSYLCLSVSLAFPLFLFFIFYKNVSVFLLSLCF